MSMPQSEFARFVHSESDGAARILKSGFTGGLFKAKSRSVKAGCSRT